MRRGDGASDRQDRNVVLTAAEISKHIACTSADTNLAASTNADCRCVVDPNRWPRLEARSAVFVIDGYVWLAKNLSWLGSHLFASVGPASQSSVSPKSPMTLGRLRRATVSRDWWRQTRPCAIAAQSTPQPTSSKAIAVGARAGPRYRHTRVHYGSRGGRLIRLPK